MTFNNSHETNNTNTNTNTTRTNSNSNNNSNINSNNQNNKDIETSLVTANAKPTIILDTSKSPAKT